jgi:hypothetical protein
MLLTHHEACKTAAPTCPAVPRPHLLLLDEVVVRLSEDAIEVGLGEALEGHTDGQATLQEGMGRKGGRREVGVEVTGGIG